MTDPADLTERARALAQRIRERYRAPGNEHLLSLDDAAAEIAALVQSDGGEWRAKLAEQCGKTLAAAAVERKLIAEWLERNGHYDIADTLMRNAGETRR